MRITLWQLNGVQREPACSVHSTSGSTGNCKPFIVRGWGLKLGSPKGFSPQPYKMTVAEHWTPEVIDTYNARNPNRFEMWNNNSFVILYQSSAIQTALKCGTLIHLLFYKYSTIQTTLKCGIVIHLLFLHLLRNPNCCEMRDLLIVLVWSVLIFTSLIQNCIFCIT